MVSGCYGYTCCSCGSSSPTLRRRKLRTSRSGDAQFHRRRPRPGRNACSNDTSSARNCCGTSTGIWPAIGSRSATPRSWIPQSSPRRKPRTARRRCDASGRRGQAVVARHEGARGGRQPAQAHSPVLVSAANVADCLTVPYLLHGKDACIRGRIRPTRTRARPCGR